MKLVVAAVLMVALGTGAAMADSMTKATPSPKPSAMHSKAMKSDHMKSDHMMTGHAMTHGHQMTTHEHSMMTHEHMAGSPKPSATP